MALSVARPRSRCRSAGNSRRALGELQGEKPKQWIYILRIQIASAYDDKIFCARANKRVRPLQVRQYHRYAGKVGAIVRECLKGFRVAAGWRQ
jgi:hypothetical protein